VPSATTSVALNQRQEGSAHEMDGARRTVIVVVAGKAVPAVPEGVSWALWLAYHRLLGFLNGNALFNIAPIFGDHH